MHDVELTDAELILLCECLKTDKQASLSLLSTETDIEHARSLSERVVRCNILLKGLE